MKVPRDRCLLVVVATGRRCQPHLNRWAHAAASPGAATCLRVDRGAASARIAQRYEADRRVGGSSRSMQQRLGLADCLVLLALAARRMDRREL